VIFAPALRYLDALARTHGIKEALAYFHPNWTRRDAPLLDHLGAVMCVQRALRERSAEIRRC
jgi:hypothetical protein